MERPRPAPRPVAEGVRLGFGANAWARGARFCSLLMSLRLRAPGLVAVSCAHAPRLLEALLSFWRGAGLVVARAPRPVEAAPQALGQRLRATRRARLSRRRALLAAAQ